MESRITCLLVAIWLVVSAISGADVRKRDVTDFTTPIRLEKLFTLEGDILILVEFVYKAESRANNTDMEELELMNTMISDVKDVHAVDTDTWTHIAHPINAYHLTKRFRTRWRMVLDTLQSSEYCKQSQLQGRLQNLMATMPPTEPLAEVAHSLAKLLNGFHLLPNDIINGSLANRTSTFPLTADDAYDIAIAAHTNDDYYSAIMWFNQTAAMLDSLPEADAKEWKFNKTQVMTLLAAANYKAGRPHAALSITKDILELNPDHARTQKNLKFYQEKTNKNGDRALVWRGEDRSAYCVTHRQLCSQVSHPKFVQTTAQPNLHCHVMSAWKGCPWAIHRVEILNRRPLIMVIHNATYDNFTDVHRNDSRAKLLRHSYLNLGAYPNERVPLTKLDILNHSLAATTFITERAHRVVLPYDKAVLQIRNYGSLGTCQKPNKNLRKLSAGGRVAMLYLMTSTNVTGGNLIFPSEGVVAPVIKNAMVFYYATSTQPAVCPSLYDTVWYMWQSYHEKLSTDTCRSSDRKFMSSRSLYFADSQL